MDNCNMLKANNQVWLRDPSGS